MLAEELCVLILVGLGLNVLGPLVNKGVFEHILFWCVAATQQLGIGRYKLGRVVVWVLDVH